MGGAVQTQVDTLQATGDWLGKPTALLVEIGSGWWLGITPRAGMGAGHGPELL